jgi:ketosteroid isomerase-like protein
MAIIRSPIKQKDMKSLMTYTGFACSILLICAIMAGCNNHCETSRTATAEELSQMNRDFAAALNNRDAQAAANCYTADATLLPPNEAPVSGRANIQKYWEGAIAAGAFDVAVATLSTGSKGDLGYEIGRFQMSTRDSNGKVTTERGKYIELLKRGEDGRWKSTHGIWNTDTLPLK